MKKKIFLTAIAISALTVIVSGCGGAPDSTAGETAAVESGFWMQINGKRAVSDSISMMAEEAITFSLSLNGELLELERCELRDVNDNLIEDAVGTLGCSGTVGEFIAPEVESIPARYIKLYIYIDTSPQARTILYLKFPAVEEEIEEVDIESEEDDVLLCHETIVNDIGPDIDSCFDIKDEELCNNAFIYMPIWKEYHNCFWSDGETDRVPYVGCFIRGTNNNHPCEPPDDFQAGEEDDEEFEDNGQTDDGDPQASDNLCHEEEVGLCFDLSDEESCVRSYMFDGYWDEYHNCYWSDGNGNSNIGAGCFMAGGLGSPCKFEDD